MNNKKDISVVEDMEPHILETVRIECPKCHAEISANAEDKEDIICFCCARKISVKDRVGDLKSLHIQETLCLPKGSIRAFVALLLSITCWTLVFKENRIPNFLLNLLVAVISYYFAFRGHPSLSNFNNMASQKLKLLVDEFSDVTASGKPKPLYLPAGFIRYILIGGFAICTLVGFGGNSHLFHTPHVREFFIILAGLVVGYFFAKFANMFKKEISIYNMITHGKGIIVLFATSAIPIIMFSGMNIPYSLIICSCLITFYFGSKS